MSTLNPQIQLFKNYLLSQY